MDLHLDRQRVGEFVHGGGQFGRDAVAKELGDVEGFTIWHGWCHCTPGTGSEFQSDVPPAGTGSAATSLGR